VFTDAFASGGIRANRTKLGLALRRARKLTRYGSAKMTRPTT
jgi:hypothetical protein